MMGMGVDALCVAEWSGRAVVKGRGGRTCRGLPIGIGSGEQA
jgi:hypothetical protein